jgi:restriction system protein
MNMPKHAWVVRAGDNNEIAELVEQVNAVAIGWKDMGDLSDLLYRDEFKNRFRECYPEETSNSRINVNTGQVFRFAREIEVGDYILTYIWASREYLIGTIEKPYEYNSQLVHQNYPHIRQVKWIRKVSRDMFSNPAKNSLGSALTVFKVDEHLDEISKIATNGKLELDDEQQEEELLPFYDDVKAKADELISDRISHLGAFEMQDLVAALLRAMGYRAVSVKPGPDRGVDIEASPDALGFEKPRVKVQVKHRIGNKVSGPEMRSFTAVIRSEDYGLYVSTGGFTKEAEFEAEKSHKVIKLLDREQFIELLLEYYDLLDTEFKAKLPLNQVWLPME